MHIIFDSCFESKECTLLKDGSFLNIWGHGGGWFGFGQFCPCTKLFSRHAAAYKFVSACVCLHWQIFFSVLFFFSNFFFFASCPPPHMLNNTSQKTRYLNWLTGALQLGVYFDWISDVHKNLLRELKGFIVKLYRSVLPYKSYKGQAIWLFKWLGKFIDVARILFFSWHAWYFSFFACFRPFCFLIRPKHREPKGPK